MKKLLMQILGWFDNKVKENEYQAKNFPAKEIDWPRVIPYLGLHFGLISLFYVGYSHTALAVFIFMYVSRMFAITGFYHRYFSHKTFKTSRLMQFFFALVGASAVQRGPLWWASHHRRHHVHSDSDQDQHSPKVHSFFWSHTGWFLTKANFLTETRWVKELSRFPELRLIDRFDSLIPILTCVMLYGLGESLAYAYPATEVTGWQLVAWGFVFSTVILYHSTFLINSASHLWGKKRYQTQDGSKNNFFLALLTFGEGWHNNHHHYPGSAKQGFYWWEIDITYYLLRILSLFGIIWDLKTVSSNVRESNKIKLK